MCSAWPVSLYFRVGLHGCDMQDLETYMDTLDCGTETYAESQRLGMYALAERVSQQVMHAQLELETLVSRLNRVYDHRDDSVRCSRAVPL